MAEYSCVCCDRGFNTKVLKNLSRMVCIWFKRAQNATELTVNQGLKTHFKSTVISPLHLAVLTTCMVNSPERSMAESQTSPQFHQ